MKNKPAFPIIEHNFEDANRTKYHVHGARGLTKREYFAGLAMQALILEPRFNKYLEDFVSPKEAIGERAKAALNNADALLEELERTSDE